MTSLYRLLGVRKTAKPETINKAYRRKAKFAHPDVNGGDDTKFLALKAARDTLLDPERRKIYDETGSAEPPPPNNETQNALQLISQALGAIIKDDKDHLAENVVAIMVSVLDKSVQNLNTGLAGLRRAAGKADRLKDRFTRKSGGDNALARSLDWHIREIAKATAATEHQIKVHRKAIEILEDYEFRADASQAQGGFMTAMFSNATSATSTSGAWGRTSL